MEAPPRRWVVDATRERRRDKAEGREAAAEEGCRGRRSGAVGMETEVEELSEDMFRRRRN